ncbi:hypothetical protein SKAU_G00257730 [Synaphobranchus kaupii]|uniref:Reverse transcriptase domain-containing protein n=1 Tax=Synaphobranchus kaupii TaxID=118154 RepID=A0A9Q1F445_SYNKA|nr:hypothetical protein SKAU_G00257730 [Synaphobranchus kaupii]
MEPDKDSRIMRKCRCGWEKVTTFRGLRIHQGKKRCTARGQQKQCTATAGQTLGTKSQVSNHRAEGSNAADGRQEAEGPVVESSPLESGTENTPGTPTINNQQASQRREKKEPGRRQAIKWPKANEPAVWQKLDNDITVLLEHSLRGRVETKLNSLGDILYEECRSRFGVVAERRRAAPKQKGRREREIEQLVWRRRQLRKQWRKASQEEKEGLKPLWEEVRKSLSNLRRAERIRQRRRRKEKERSNFFKNPFKHAKQLLEDKRSGKLEITKPELEKHIREQYSDPAKAIPLGSPGYVPRPAPPVIPFNTAPPKLSEVADVVRKARAASAPGPNGVPYKLYKYCPGVRKILWKLLKVAWGKNIIPSEWQRAVTVFIPKEQNSNSISQFRSIALLNVEGKIFFSIMAKRLTSYLTSNSYIDTSCQKAGVPGFPGCVEHSAVIWEQIQRARREKSDLHVVWLDLANAYGSVPHQLINFALEFFHTPNCIKDLVAKYFADLQMCCAHQDFTTGWQQLEVGIAMGCSISPILFIAAFEIILIGARKMAGGVKMPSGQRLPPLRGFMDDVTTILQTAACTTRLLKRMDELVGWARMKIKPSKSRSLSLRKGVRNDHTIFTAGGEEIPLLSKQPIRSLGRSYTAELSDKQVGEAVRKQLADGLARIHRSQLPGKYKHILSGCKTALSQGRYRWRHDAVLKKLAEVAESCRREANIRPAAPARHTIQFARAGENINAPRPSNMGRLLSPGSEWNMKVDLGRQLQFPREIAETSLRPDMVLWSVASKTVLLVELTVPWEGGLETAHERKRAKYSDLAAECREAGWKATICPVEVGCRGFVGSSASRLLRDLGCTGAGHRRASKELAEEAEKGSFWLWLRRKDTSWGPCNT